MRHGVGVMGCTPRSYLLVVAEKKDHLGRVRNHSHDTFHIAVAIATHQYDSTLMDKSKRFMAQIAQDNRKEQQKLIVCELE